MGAGIAFVDGPHVGVVAPTETLAAWTRARYGAGAALVTELAGFVYHRKAWFADDLDPLVLRDRRPGQYELRVFTELAGEPVPLFAMDLAPLRHDGSWSSLDSSAPRPTTPSADDIRSVAMPVAHADRNGAVASSTMPPE